MKTYRWMRTIYLMNSGAMKKVRKFVVLPGSMNNTVLKRAIATLARSEAKPTKQL